LNSYKSLLFHGGDTGSIPVRDAKFTQTQGDSCRCFDIGLQLRWLQLTDALFFFVTGLYLYGSIA
jgi:hypothetical protein